MKPQEILNEAITAPGKLLRAYRAFHGYSLMNRILAYVQCKQRGIKISPIAPYGKWKERGRFVRKGEKAIELCMPLVGKYKEANEQGEEEVKAYTKFVFKKNWFVLSQTEGKEYAENIKIKFDETKACEALGIERIPFEKLNGNCQGYAGENKVAINPLAQLPVKTLFHEMAHVVLGHTKSAYMTDNEDISRSLKEAEAEAVALLCLESLGLKGSEYCRGYIQKWLSGEEIPEKSAQKIMSTADKILKAGI